MIFRHTVAPCRIAVNIDVGLIPLGTTGHDTPHSQQAGRGAKIFLSLSDLPDVRSELCEGA
jgi:hypothetical protein